MQTLSTAQAVVSMLELNGIDTLFCLPGVQNDPFFDALYDRLQLIKDGPERQALFDHAVKLAIAYMPYKYTLNRLATDMVYPQLVGYRRPVFWLDWWQYVDIDDTLRPAR